MALWLEGQTEKVREEIKAYVHSVVGLVLSNRNKKLSINELPMLLHNLADILAYMLEMKSHGR